MTEESQEEVFKFIRESNKIEGIGREPTTAEIAEYKRFMDLPCIGLGDVEQFVKVYQPNAKLRSMPGLNVYVGNHVPPPGGMAIVYALDNLLLSIFKRPAEAYEVHQEYEQLHPFTDGNGRSGRMIWKWMMRKAPLGFLHHWYYQSLDARRKNEF